MAHKTDSLCSSNAKHVHIAWCTGVIAHLGGLGFGAMYHFLSQLYERLRPVAAHQWVPPFYETLLNLLHGNLATG